MINILSFRKESIQKASSANVALNRKSDGVKDARGARIDCAHQNPAITTITFTITVP